MKNKTFSILTQRQWTTTGSGELNHQLNELLELRSQNYFELHVKKVEKRSTRMKIQISGYALAGFDHLKMKHSMS